MFALNSRILKGCFIKPELISASLGGLKVQVQQRYYMKMAYNID
jgi:hypothetical protein